jgi:8-hydroxy-5-deazaflavin:NADPH oxidoreductase
MRVGILGLGWMGSKLGTIFARAGHDVVFSYATPTDQPFARARAFLGRSNTSVADTNNSTPVTARPS